MRILKNRLFLQDTISGRLFISIKLYGSSNMVEKKQLNVRVPAELFDKIDNSGMSKQELVEEALELYFDSKSDSNMLEYNSNSLENNSNLIEDHSNLLAETLSLKKEIQFKDVIIKAKEDNIRDLQNQTGFLISEFQRINKINEQLLLTEPESIRKWWEFWKK